MKNSLNEFLTFLNPHKIISVLMSFTSALEKIMGANFTNAFKIKLMLHTGCALERMVIEEPLTYSGDRDAIDSEVLRYVQEAATLFKDTLNISLTDDEIYYICETFAE